MMLHVPEVLSPDQVREMRTALDATQWTDGRETVGAQGAQVKRNRQLPEQSAVGRELGNIVLAALARHSLFFSAALPSRFVPPLFNRYEGASITAFMSTVRSVLCPAVVNNCALTCRAPSSCATPKTTRAANWR